MGQDRLRSLRKISLRKDALKEVENKNIFHDSIVQRFAEKPGDWTFF